MADNSHSPQGPLFVGDDLALDFINTRYGVGAAHRDCLVDDASVVAWLETAQVLPVGFEGTPQGLLQLALELRESARALVSAAKSQGEADADTDTSVVNLVLESGRASRHLEWDSASKAFRWVTQRGRGDAASLLEPIAQAVVSLLTDTPLERVRQCEAHDCTLLFQDLTKSHRRRWCSMAACGNRMKVAAFRSRQKAE